MRSEVEEEDYKRHSYEDNRDRRKRFKGDNEEYKSKEKEDDMRY